MDLIKTIRLNPEQADKKRLLDYCRKVNAVCNELSIIAFNEKIFNWYNLQKRVYRLVRDKHGLMSAQIVSTVRKVCDAYKKQKKTIAVFRPLGAIPLCKHKYKKDGTIRFYGFRIPFKSRPDILLSGKIQGQLLVHGKKFLVQQVIRSEPPKLKKTDDYLGVDLGVKNIAVDSDGTFFTGREVNGLRIRHKELRAKLQSIGTKSAKRLLKKRSGQESHFARNINHIVSKKIVNRANDTGRGIAIEDLKGIRASIKVRKPQRGLLHSWSFGQLRSFIQYKAEQVGIPVVVVNPRNTSRTCPNCGCVDKRNRKTQAFFKCVRCGYAGLADYIAAINISRAARNQPNAVSRDNCKCALSA